MKQIKYPKTPYLPFSPTVDAEDPVIDPTVFLGKSLCVSIKMDGSNVAMNRDEVYGRSTHHPSFNQIKQLHSMVKHLIPEGDHVFGESLVAKHSIHYTGDLALNSPFQIFAVYSEKEDEFGDWEYVTLLASELDIPAVTTVEFSVSTLQELQTRCEAVFKRVVAAGHEGIVVRNRAAFKYADFGVNVAKMVRPQHVQSKTHWTKQEIVYNQCQSKPS